MVWEVLKGYGRFWLVVEGCGRIKSFCKVLGICACFLEVSGRVSGTFYTSEKFWEVVEGSGKFW